MEAIAIEGLTKYYGKLLALDNLNLKIDKGHCVGFLGPNGAGKSTTIKILCNLIRPTQGRAYIFGIDVLTDAEKALKDVGSIVEVPEFYSYMNPVEILSYLGKLRGLAGSNLGERIREVLELVRLSEWSKTKIGNFSRGMKQRLGIAQAVLHAPPLLILDEPALGLDPRGMYEIREIIKGIVKEGRTIFLASHMLHEVQEVCDEVALINRGELLAYGKVEELGRIFKARKVEVEVLQPPNNEQVKKIKELKPVKAISVGRNSLTISFEGDEATQTDLLSTLIKDLGLQVASFKPSLEILEEIYLELVKEVT